MVASKSKIQGKVSVISAICGNFFIALLKLAGFFISGSASMFSEAMHSIADTANQGLLLVGLKRSVKKSDDKFEYGYGRERFIWALISACGIFFVGAGITVYHGVIRLFSEEHFEINPAVLIILIISFFVESLTLYIAVHELKKSHPEKNLRKAFKRGDPTTIAVIYEDTVGVIGVLIAFVSILLANFTGKIYFDAFGSILVGLMLGGMAIILINKNRRMLIGRSIPHDFEDIFYKIMYADPIIEKVLDVKSSTLDINVYRIKCEVEINGSALMREMFEQGDLKKEYGVIKDDYDEYVKLCLNLIDRTPRIIGKKIDELESRIKAELPSVKHIDIEVN